MWSLVSRPAQGHGSSAGGHCRFTCQTQDRLKIRADSKVDFTDRVRSAREGYVSTGVCHSVQGAGCLVHLGPPKIKKQTGK